MPQQGQRVLVLDDLPIGRATVTIAGYLGDFAPAPAGVTATCRTLSSTGVTPCDQSRIASAAFESDPEPVTIFPGALVNLGTVELVALPFLLHFTPPQNTQVPQPVDLAFTIVDASTGIAAPSVALDITLDVAEGEPQTRRVPLELDPCMDGTARPCSPQGNLGLSGFKARGAAEQLPFPAGPVTARITAQNLADPPRALDFTYMFVALPAPTDTPVATNTPTPARTAEPTRTPVPSDTPTEVPTSTRTASATVTRTRTLSPTVTLTATHTATRTETAVPPTRTPTETPVPTPTTLCNVTPRAGCRTSGRSKLLIKVTFADRSRLTWRWLRGTAPLAEFGDPTTATSYGLCVYASTAGVPALAVDIGVRAASECRRSPCWSRLGTGTLRGYQFGDPFRAQHGMHQLRVKGGKPGRDSLLAAAGGEDLVLPLPFNANRLFAQEDVIVQLVTDAGGCWQSVFRPHDVRLNLPEVYQASR
jgi:hypothetical protein